jgi:hypothetical protein
LRLIKNRGEWGFKIITMKERKFSKGWDEDRVNRVIAHCESQSEEEAMAEDEAAWEDASQTFMEIPNDLIPAVRNLLAKREKKAGEKANE